jgi:hypothetical protein
MYDVFDPGHPGTWSSKLSEIDILEFQKIKE